MLLRKLGAGWPEKPSWSWQEFARSKPTRILFSPLLRLYHETLLIRTRLRSSASEHKSGFEDPAWLIRALTRCSETETRRHTGRVNHSQVAAKEERIFAISGRDRKRKRAAARAVEQVDCAIADASCAHDVLNSGRQRKSTLEVVSSQERSSLGTRALGYSDLGVSRYICDLEVGLYYPTSLGVGVDQVVDIRVIE